MTHVSPGSPSPARHRGVAGQRPRKQSLVSVLVAMLALAMSFAGLTLTAPSGNAAAPASVYENVWSTVNGDSFDGIPMVTGGSQNQTVSLNFQYTKEGAAGKTSVITLPDGFNITQADVAAIENPAIQSITVDNGKVTVVFKPADQWNNNQGTFTLNY